jgi:hypothetical protein
LLQWLLRLLTCWLLQQLVSLRVLLRFTLLPFAVGTCTAATAAVPLLRLAGSYPS